MLTYRQGLLIMPEDEYQEAIINYKPYTDEQLFASVPTCYSDHIRSLARNGKRYVYFRNTLALNLMPREFDFVGGEKAIHNLYGKKFQRLIKLNPYDMPSALYIDDALSTKGHDIIGRIIKNGGDVRIRYTATVMISPIEVVDALKLTYKAPEVHIDETNKAISDNFITEYSRDSHFVIYRNVEDGTCAEWHKPAIQHGISMYSNGQTDISRCNYKLITDESVFSPQCSTIVMEVVDKETMRNNPTFKRAVEEGRAEAVKINTFEDLQKALWNHYLPKGLYHANGVDVRDKAKSIWNIFGQMFGTWMPITTPHENFNFNNYAYQPAYDDHYRSSVGVSYTGPDYYQGYLNSDEVFITVALNLMHSFIDWFYDDLELGSMQSPYAASANREAYENGDVTRLWDSCILENGNEHFVSLDYPDWNEEYHTLHYSDLGY